MIDDKEKGLYFIVENQIFVSSVHYSHIVMSYSLRS